jgi:hypothetical protein
MIAMSHFAASIKFSSKTSRRYWRVKIDPTVLKEDASIDWQKGSCTCTPYFKNYICKHLVGLAILLKHVIAPPFACSTRLDQAKKRGRPREAGPALVRFQYTSLIEADEANARENDVESGPEVANELANDLIAAAQSEMSIHGVIGGAEGGVNDTDIDLALLATELNNLPPGDVFDTLSLDALMTPENSNDGFLIPPVPLSVSSSQSASIAQSVPTRRPLLIMGQRSQPSTSSEASTTESSQETAQATKKARKERSDKGKVRGKRLKKD